MPYAGHLLADGASCQANIMANPSIWGAMIGAFHVDRRPTPRSPARRAGRRRGGRGRYSRSPIRGDSRGACPRRLLGDRGLSARRGPSGAADRARRRLCTLHDAYVLAGNGDAMVNEHRYEEAADLYRRAAGLAPDSIELRFWSALGIAQLGDVAAGAHQVREVIAQSPGWGDLLARLPDNIMPSVTILRSTLGIPTALAGSSRR